MKTKTMSKTTLYALVTALTLSSIQPINCSFEHVKSLLRSMQIVGSGIASAWLVSQAAKIRTYEDEENVRTHDVTQDVKPVSYLQQYGAFALIAAGYGLWLLYKSYNEPTITLEILRENAEPLSYEAYMTDKDLKTYEGFSHPLALGVTYLQDVHWNTNKQSLCIKLGHTVQKDKYPEITIKCTQDEYQIFSPFLNKAVATVQPIKAAKNNHITITLTLV